MSEPLLADYGDFDNMPDAIDGVPIRKHLLGNPAVLVLGNIGGILLNATPQARAVWDDLPEYMRRAYESGWHSTPEPAHVVYRGLARVLDNRQRRPGRAEHVAADPAAFAELAAQVSRCAAQGADEFVTEVFAGARAGRVYSLQVRAFYARLGGPVLPKYNPNHAPGGSSEGGQFAPAGGGGSAAPKPKPGRGAASGSSDSEPVASSGEQKASLKQARKKIADSPVPTKADVAKARADLANAARAGGDSRGGSAASRRIQRENLFKEFGGEARGYVVCPWTGLKMHWTDDPKVNPKGYPKFERGKIFTKLQGGGYRLPNLIPESFAANRSRNDKPIRTENLK